MEHLQCLKIIIFYNPGYSLRESSYIMALPYSHRLFWWCLFLWTELPVSRPKCIFDEVQAHVRPLKAAPLHTGQEQFKDLHNQKLFQPQRSTRDIGSPQPIRIKTWFPEESHFQSEEERGRLKAAVEEAVGTVSSLLSVNRVPGPLLLKRDINKYCKFIWRNASSLNYNRCGRANKAYRNETCLDVTIPDEHLKGCVIYPELNSSLKIMLRPEGTGFPDTDFLLYLHVRATDKCRSEPNVQAYAAHCQTGSDGRPLAGVVIICRERLVGVLYNHHTTVLIIIHELFHVLGFSKTLFGSWRDCSTSFRLGCSLRSRMIRPDASGQMRIYSPSVTSALQRHLRTTDPDIGGLLENKDAGPSGVSSHWESRLMQGSIMSAVLNEPSVVRIDPVTLYALQDTGWYTADLEWAQPLVWGEGEGNLFGSPSTCKNNSAFFCSGSGFGCHYLHLHKGQCHSDPYLDGCHIYKPILNGSECFLTENAQQAAQDEMFGSDSRCFFSTLSKQDHVMNTSVEGRCYKHRCTGLNTYQIQVHGADWMDCPAGGAIRIKGYQGFVWCPDKRLCVPEVAPAQFLSHNTSKSKRVVWSFWRTSAVVVALTFSLVLVVTISCRCCKVRVHSLQHEHNLHQTLP
ncbi:ciliated left-right organizer metallopeptidase isoform X2 [Boleophthalmus pectinirostris]|uniref:ciliated left-right organizer metallopeptidase isoform X2 n=1 Tax=Boleophthalmus pectinirostris TaxID=150288 RepID=UPI00242E3AE1|nr:ciliated left-right organizer metallopeptidase isoform X2 [Boleophthalmus pectinirostris]